MVKNSQDTNKTGNVAIVIGATSRIAISLIEDLANDARFTKIVAISRQFSARVLVYTRVYGINIAFLVVSIFKYKNIFWTGILGDTGVQ